MVKVRTVSGKSAELDYSERFRQRLQEERSAGLRKRRSRGSPLRTASRLIRRQSLRVKPRRRGISLDEAGALALAVRVPLGELISPPARKSHHVHTIRIGAREEEVYKTRCCARLEATETHLRELNDDVKQLLRDGAQQGRDTIEGDEPCQVVKSPRRSRLRTAS